MSDSIQVTCLACNRTIKAPRAAGGKWGKCPNCKARVYVPMAEDELEEIPLAPLDEPPPSVDAEARAVAADLLRDKDLDTAPTRSGAAPKPPRAVPKPVAAAELSDLIVEYLLAMKDSRLDDAAKTVNRLKSSAAQAQSRVQQMMVDAMPPSKLGDVPAPLYVGFLKKLQQQLG